MGSIEKEWASRFYTVMVTLKADTTPERIKANRDKILPLVVEAKKLKKAGYKGKVLDEVIDLYHYFDVGRKPINNIDGLHDKVKLSLAELE